MAAEMSLCSLVNFAGSWGTAMAAIYVGQQVVLERMPSRFVEHAHRIVLASLAVLFVINSFQEHGPWGAALSMVCFAFFVLRAVTRNFYMPPPGSMWQPMTG